MVFKARRCDCWRSSVKTNKKKKKNQCKLNSVNLITIRCSIKRSLSWCSSWITVIRNTKKNLWVIEEKIYPLDSPTVPRTAKCVPLINVIFLTKRLELQTSNGKYYVDNLTCRPFLFFELPTLPPLSSLPKIRFKTFAILYKSVFCVS